MAAACPGSPEPPSTCAKGRLRATPTERSAGRAPTQAAHPRAQALPPPCSPWPAPPQPGLVPAFHGEPHFLSWHHHAQHVPQATWGDQGSSPQPMRKALSPCPRPHNTDTCPWQHLPQGRSTMAVTQPWTPVTPGHRPSSWGPKPSSRVQNSHEGPWVLGDTAQGPLQPAASTSNSILDGNLPEGRDHPGPLPEEG